MNIELYIANRLCDLEKSDLSIKLKRQFFNPTELNTKDAQKSYTITLPSTPANDLIFGYKNVEETDGKFTIYPDAKLYVDGILILEGKFRLSEITRHSYKGNLGVPAPLTVKDVFGEMKMNQAGSWMLDYKDVDAITYWNKEISPPAFFPLVLYGLLPSTNQQNKLVIDANTKFSIEDFPPSVNCIQMLEKIFLNANYTLTGTATTDERLTNLYVSYRNPNDYTMPFSYKKAVINGSWSNYKNGKHETRAKLIDHTYPGVDSNTPQNFVACNLFQSDNADIYPTDDLSHLVHRNDQGYITYRVPRSGLYKIVLDASFKYIPGNLRKEVHVDEKNINILSPYYVHKGAPYSRNFNNQAAEIKLVRTTKDGDSPYDISKATMDNTYYKNNQNQEYGIGKAKFPKGDKTYLSTNFIDPYQNPNLLCGFSFGRLTKENRRANEGFANKVPEYYNPQEENNPIASEGTPLPTTIENIGAPLGSCPMAIRYGNTWNDNPGEGVTIPFIHSASNHLGYSDNSLIVDMPNAPANYVAVDQNALQATGNISQIVWLDAGETLALLSTTDKAKNGDWIHQHIEFTLAIEPFNPNIEWLTEKMDKKGHSTKSLNWNDKAEFFLQSINLIEFLPSEIKIDEWLQNFCKAFNLELQHTEGKNFELNVKNKANELPTSLVIDLDQKAAVQQGSNQSLGLPHLYQLGFTIDTAEEGYYSSMNAKSDTDPTKVLNTGNTGGGDFYTGSNEPGKVEQKSNFSYCWHKKIEDRTNEGDTPLEIPVITDYDIWLPSTKYSEVATKNYFNKAQRFWYKKDNHRIKLYNNDLVDIGLVSNEYMGKLILDYQDKPNSIAQIYFKLLDNDNSYTMIECYLSPEEYDNLGKSYIKYNGDLYTVVEADGYDPMRKDKTKLKLLKKK